MLVRPYDHTPFVRHLISNRNHRTDNYAFPPQVFRREDRRTFSWFSCMMVPRPRGRRTYFCHLLLILHQLKCGGGSTRSGNSTVHREPERLKESAQLLRDHNKGRCCCGAKKKLDLPMDVPTKPRIEALETSCYQLSGKPNDITASYHLVRGVLF
jgi:hypothetical protein